MTRPQFRPASRFQCDRRHKLRHLAPAAVAGGLIVLSAVVGGHMRGDAGRDTSGSRLGDARPTSDTALADAAARYARTRLQCTATEDALRHLVADIGCGGLLDVTAVVQHDGTRPVVLLTATLLTTRGSGSPGGGPQRVPLALRLDRSVGAHDWTISAARP